MASEKFARWALSLAADEIPASVPTPLEPVWLGPLHLNAALNKITEMDRMFSKPQGSSAYTALTSMLCTRQTLMTTARCSLSSARNICVRCSPESLNMYGIAEGPPCLDSAKGPA
jgi:hypothetical protein